MQHLAHGNLEALTQASFIFILGIAIVLLNLLVIATFINFRGEFSRSNRDDKSMCLIEPFRSPRSH